MIKPWVRNLLFWSFFIFFFIAAPTSVLYTAGYRYNVQNGQIVRTGVISVNTEPRNARIYLNGEDTEKGTPYIIKRLMPMTYSVLIERDGYLPWHGEVEVKSGATALLQPIQLFKDSSPKLVLKEDVNSISSNGDNVVVYLVREGGWSEIWLYNIETQGQSIIDMQISSKITEDAELDWSAHGERVSIFDPSTNYFSIYSKDETKLEVDSTLYKSAEKVFWHPSNDSRIFFSSASILYEVNLDSGEVVESKTDDVVGIVLDASVMSFIENDAYIELHQTSNDDDELIALLPKDEYSIAHRDGSYLILTGSNDAIILLNIREERPILLEVQANSFDWLDSENLLVYTDGMEVNIYDPQVHRTTFITRQGENIENILWHPDGINIFLVTKENVYAIERFRIAKQRQTTPLIEDAVIDSFWISDSGQFGYFYGTFGEDAQDTGVFSIELTK